MSMNNGQQHAPEAEWVVQPGGSGLDHRRAGLQVLFRTTPDAVEAAWSRAWELVNNEFRDLYFTRLNSAGPVRELPRHRRRVEGAARKVEELRAAKAQADQAVAGLMAGGGEDPELVVKVGDARRLADEAADRLARAEGVLEDLRGQAAACQQGVEALWANITATAHEHVAAALQGRLTAARNELALQASPAVEELAMIHLTQNALRKNYNWLGVEWPWVETLATRAEEAARPPSPEPEAPAGQEALAPAPAAKGRGKQAAATAG
jgi:hypothetical protein